MHEEYIVEQVWRDDRTVASKIGYSTLEKARALKAEGIAADNERYEWIIYHVKEVE